MDQSGKKLDARYTVFKLRAKLDKMNPNNPPSDSTHHCITVENPDQTEANNPPGGQLDCPPGGLFASEAKSHSDSASGLAEGKLDQMEEKITPTDNSADHSHEAPNSSESMSFLPGMKLDPSVESMQATAVLDTCLRPIALGMTDSPMSYGHSAWKRVNGAVVTGPKKFSCCICEKEFTTKAHMKEHMVIHTGERKYSCGTCGDRFFRAGDLKKHMVTHTGAKNYKCEVCGREFGLRSGWRKHFLLHLGHRPHKCDICGKAFTASAHLKEHKVLHTGLKAFACGLCDKRFAHEKPLRRHMNTHTGEKKYACEVCGKRFARSDDVRRHMTVHTKEKKYKCDTCYKSYTASSALKKHSRKCQGIVEQTTSDAQVFVCENCGAEFSESTDLDEHVLSEHGGNEMTDIEGQGQIDGSGECGICGEGFTDALALQNHVEGHTEKGIDGE